MISDYFCHEIEIVNLTRDKWQQVEGERKTIWSCRVEFKTMLIQNGNGQQVVSQGRVFLPSDAPVAIGKTFRYEGIDYNVLQISPQQGLHNKSHIEVYF